MYWGQEWKAADMRRHPEEEIAKLTLKSVKLLLFADEMMCTRKTP